MGTEEKSRDAHQPRKRYAAVGMQQGRVLLDDDFNEAETIRLEDDRELAIDVIGPVGSPDDGFRVANGHLTGGRVDLELLAGTLYLSGFRLWNPSLVAFSHQPDWLNQLPADRPLAVEGRVDLAYVESWRQPVTAVEDAELFEVALAGPDTSTRLRTMWRVRLAAGVDGADCPTAWSDLVADWQAAGLGTVDDTGERVVDAELAVGFIEGEPGDLCTPAIAGGFLGAENQTIRVQLTDATHVTWGYDNGAPLYRATLAADQRTLTLLTDPRDQAHWPMAGQIVEVLAWSAVLVNGEKLAEDTGHLARVATSYDPDTHRLVLAAASAVPAGFGRAWQTRADAGSLGPPFFFVRVWNRGDDHASPPQIPFVPGTPVTLGNSGLTVTITGTARVAGDHWIIAARPATPARVVPWELEVGRGPHGVRRLFAPLALVRWHANGTFDLLHDCRPHFLPLTRLRGCCTHTVGDEVHSHGRFTSIQAAVDALPAEGGKVCVLPGTYTETVTLLGRDNVTIEGCGARSLLRPAPEATAIIAIVGGHDIAIRDLGFETGDAIGIAVVEGAALQPDAIFAARMAAKARARRLRFTGLTMHVGGRSAIAILGGIDIEIAHCEVVAGPLEKPIDPGSDLGRWPAILSFADDVLIEHNRVSAAAEPRAVPGSTTASGLVTFTRTALGGIQLGGGSERVEIRRNQISGGNGNGITLGSWAWAKAGSLGTTWDELVAGWHWVPGGFHIHINDEGCIEIDWDPPPPDGGGEDQVPVSMGAVERVRIVDNLITEMGQGGIGIARFFDLSRRDELILVRDLHVQDNRIHGCLLLPIPELPEAMRGLAAQAAITLADVEQLVVRGNDIAANGKRHIDPICGVFALVSTGVAIEHNRIVDNAPPAATAEPVRPGWRGGVVLVHAVPPTLTVPIGRVPVLRQDGQPAVRIADNVIVVPEGRPILVLALGAVAIADNQLTTRGAGLSDIAALLAAGGTIEDIAKDIGESPLQTLIELFGGLGTFVLDTGISNELFYLQLISYLNLNNQDLVPRPGLDPRPPIAASGNISFHGNQVGIDLLRPPSNVVLTGVALLGLDDIQGSGNQIEIDRLGDSVRIGWLALGLTTRITDNRVKEVLVRPVAANTGTSITSLGVLLNMTTGNQTSRCITATGASKTEQPNHVMLELMSAAACDPRKAITAAFGNANLSVAVVNWE